MRNARKGFTLLEIVIVSALLMIVSIAIYLMLFNASATYTDLTRAGDIEERARRVTDEISRELRAADTTQSLTLTRNTRANSITFRVPKRVDATSGAIIWSTQNDTFLGFYNAGSPYPARPCVVSYRYETSTLDANRNRVQDEGRIARVLLDPATGAEIAGTHRVLSDFLRAPTTGGGEVFQRGNDDTVMINLTFITVDNRNKVLERNIQTSVSIRNKS
jgi:type II secretory pathway pseudopilin PulG